MRIISREDLFGDRDPTEKSFPDLLREQFPLGMANFVIVDLYRSTHYDTPLPNDMPYGIRGLIGKGEHALVFLDDPEDGPEADILSVFGIVAAHCNAAPVDGKISFVSDNHKNEFNLPIHMTYQSS